MTEPDDFFEELRREYLTEAAARLGELRKDLAAVVAGEVDAAASLKTRFHRLAGSGGSYGFPKISEAARSAERWLAAHPSPGAGDVAPIEQAIGTLAAAFDGAATELGLPTTGPTVPTVFDWRALAVGPASDLMDLVETTLADEHYTVVRKPIGIDPADIAVSERPDLVVLVLEGSEIEPAVRRWTEGSIRPSWLVLIAPGEMADPWAEPYGDLDLVITPDRAERDLGNFARTASQAVTAPRSVLIVDPDLASTASLVAALEAASVRTSVVASATEARAAVQRDSWDAVVTEWQLPDSTGRALTRWLRRLPSYRLSPILIVSSTLTDDDRLAAIRAGADDALKKTGTPNLLADSVRARVYRARLARSRAHRDDLTGLLNYDSLTEELDRAISGARRANEPIGVLMFDVDHLRRLNEQHGHLAGDLALTHVGRIIASTVRSSDLVARIGAEEFGVLIRRCRLEDAGRVGEKVRLAIADSSMLFGELPLSVRVSCGVAGYPDHGSTAQEIHRAADRALLSAKASGRNRTVVAQSG